MELTAESKRLRLGSIISGVKEAVLMKNQFLLSNEIRRRIIRPSVRVMVSHDREGLNW